MKNLFAIKGKKMVHKQDTVSMSMLTRGKFYGSPTLGRKLMMVGRGRISLSQRLTLLLFIQYIKVSPETVYNM